MTQFRPARVLEFQQVIQDLVLAHAGTEDEAQIVVTPVDGGLRIHDVGGIVKQGDQKQGFYHQFIAPAQIPVIEYLQQARLNEVAKWFHFASAVKGLADLVSRLDMLEGRQESIAHPFHIEPANH